MIDPLEPKGSDELRTVLKAVVAKVNEIVEELNRR